MIPKKTKNRKRLNKDNNGVRSKPDPAKKLNELPNTYKFAAEALQIMSERGGSIGSIVVNKYKSYNYKLIYALVMNTLKKIKLIKKLIHETKLSKKIPVSNPFLLEILVGDLLFGRGLKTVEQNSVAASILVHKDSIIKQQNLLKNSFDVDISEASVKYLRVNTLKSSMEHVISQLEGVGLSQLGYSKEKIKFKKFINKFKSMDDTQFLIDFHFPQELIVLKPHGVEKLKKTDLLKKGKAMLQDKASYMAVEALNVQKGQNIIDACFAPGTKTSLIASKMKNNGKILAFDIDKKRFLTAQHIIKTLGVTCCKAELTDFSKVKLRRLLKNNNLEQVDSIILDPSCSGSGIKSRIDYKATNEEKGRLKKLQAFQVSLLKHALKACISKSIVYCTCSTSVEENEEVLEMALNESGVKDKWQFVEVLPYWPHRGEENFEFGRKCLRSDENNLTNGFFVAKLDLVAQTSSESVIKDKNGSDKPKKSSKPQLKSDEMELDDDESGSSIYESVDEGDSGQESESDNEDSDNE